MAVYLNTNSVFLKYNIGEVRGDVVKMINRMPVRVVI